jgi:hypothetical protein
MYPSGIVTRGIVPEADAISTAPRRQSDNKPIQAQFLK